MRAENFVGGSLLVGERLGFASFFGSQVNFEGVSGRWYQNGRLGYGLLPAEFLAGFV